MPYSVYLVRDLWLLLREPVKPHAAITIEYRHPRLSPVADLSIRAGEVKSIELVIDRQGIERPLRIELDNLPEGVSLVENDVTLSAQQSERTLQLRVQNSVSDSNSQVLVQLWDGDDLVHQQRMRLRIEALELPEFRKVETRIVARIGQRNVFTFGRRPSRSRRSLESSYQTQ